MEPQTLATQTHRTGTTDRCRNFCEEWRHSYLLLAAVFSVIWRIPALAIPRLESTRIMGGLHPMEVLLLMRMLELMWIAPLLSIILYAASFPFQRLNSASAIAVTALSSTALLGFVLVWALLCIRLA